MTQNNQPSFFEDRKNLARRMVPLSVLLLILAVIETSFFGFHPLFGAVPDLMLAALLPISCFLGAGCGAISGIFAGIFIEALGAVGICVLPVFYMIFGYTVGRTARSIGGRSLLQYGAYVGCTVAYRAVLTFIYANLNYQSVNFFKILFSAVLPEALATAVACMALVFPMKLFCRKLIGKQH